MAIYLLLEEKQGPLTAKQMELLVAARDDSDRLHSILSNLLDISRIESGRMQMDLRPEAPHMIVLEQVETFRSTAKDRGIVLKVEIPDDLPQVLADSAQIGHVLANLLSNALKYTSPGGEIFISAESGEETVCFAVTDTGRGIPDQYLDRVFDQFFRVPGQDAGAGEGLGLAIAKEIVEAHGGTIAVKSEEGAGSVFSFCLKQAEQGARAG
jgi:signal transduction histidine kinase